jgi:hypothetical protein
MPSPFPGMDPYLERRNVWPDVHSALIVATRDALAPQVAPAYYVAIEERMYIVAAETATAVANVPQTVVLPQFEEVHERYLEIRDTQTHAVVTALEILSPSNKAPGEGREAYEEKRRQVLSTRTNLVEIDLLRAGKPMEMQPPPQGDYRILVRVGWERPQARLYVCSIRQALPEVPVPLRRGEPEARLSLGQLLADNYTRAHYDLRLDYRQPPEPPLSPLDAAWAEELLRTKGLQ